MNRLRSLFRFALPAASIGLCAAALVVFAPAQPTQAAAGDEVSNAQLLNGLDDIGLTLQYEDQIGAFEQSRKSWQ